MNSHPIFCNQPPCPIHTTKLCMLEPNDTRTAHSPLVSTQVLVVFVSHSPNACVCASSIRAVSTFRLHFVSPWRGKT